MLEPQTQSQEMVGEKVIVSVIDHGDESCRRASILDDDDGAVRLVEALISAGCDPQDISVFRGQNLEVEIALRPAVVLHGPGVPPAAPTAAQVTADRIDALPAGQPQGDEMPAPAQSAPVDHDEIVRPETTVTGSPAVGDRRIHLRVDRIVWLALWTVSMIVLAASLLASFSHPAPKQFVPRAPSSDARSISDESAVLGSALSPADEGLTVQPLCARGGQDNCRCGDFGTQREAQAFYEQHSPAPGHIVDTDGDGIFCEWLPPPAP